MNCMRNCPLCSKQRFCRPRDLISCTWNVKDGDKSGIKIMLYASTQNHINKTSNIIDPRTING